MKARPLWLKSKLSQKPHPSTKHHVVGQTGCEVMAIFCISRMAVSRHLGFYRTANSAILSADSENPCLEPNIEWIGCMPFSRYSRILIENGCPLVFGALVRGEAVRFVQRPLVTIIMMGLSDSERISMIRSAVLIQSTRVTDGRTDGIAVAYTRYNIYARNKTNVEKLR